MTDMTNWNADDWHLFLCQHCDNRATSPNGLSTVALVIADAIAAHRVAIAAGCSGIALSHIGAGPDGEAYDEACRDIAEAIRVTFVKP